MLNKIHNALQLIQKGQHDEASRIFNAISGVDTEDVEIIAQRGRLAMELGENIYALQSLSKAVECKPNNFDYLFLLAGAYLNVGNLAHAADLCRKAISINPERSEPYRVLGKEADQNGDYAGAIEYFEKAISLKPSEPGPYSSLIYSLRILGRHDEAMKYAQKLLRIDTSAYGYLPLSGVLIELGRNDEAVKYLKKAIQTDKTCGHAYNDLVKIIKFDNKDDPLIKEAEKNLQLSMPVMQRSLIHFSLGKMYDDCREWDKAFEHYKQGNLLTKSAVEPSPVRDFYKAAKRAYSKSFVKDPGRAGSDSDIPVFVIGMPRSGTTLIEQIIARHPRGAGAGEFLEIGKIHYSICHDEKISDTELENKLSNDALAGYASTYLKALRAGRESADRIVDKMPDNFAFIGLIHKMFPNARYINAMRNPLDTCLSCYFQPFEYITESNDLEWIGKRYCLYREAVDHWRKLLPEGKILDVQYEQLVQDIESQSRRVIEFCGLQWDDACLKSSSTEGPIVNASSWQVRQPVYQTSIKRWPNYAKYLEPLARSVSSYLDQDDRLELEKNGIRLSKWSLGFLKRQ